LLIIESDVSGESDWYDRLDAGIAADRRPVSTAAR
jgi:hypothetical protein